MENLVGGENVLVFESKQGILLAKGIVFIYFRDIFFLTICEIFQIIDSWGSEYIN